MLTIIPLFSRNVNVKYQHCNYINIQCQYCVFQQKKRPSLSRSVIPFPYYTTFNIFCDIVFSFFCSTSACAFLNSSIRFNSSSASSNPICVYTFIVTDISECPMRYCSVLGFIPDFAIFEQYVCLHTWGVMFGICTR